MTDKAKQIIDSIKQACDVFAAMELPMAERECTLSYDAAMTLVKELEQIKRERDAAVADINMACQCDVCTRMCKYDKPNPYCECADFEWRGVKEE